MIELLVALAVFAAMATMAWGGLDSVARTRTELAHKEDDLRGLMQIVGALQRDLRQAVARPVRGDYGEPLPGFIGASNKFEFTRLGFANPQAELRSNLERVVYAFDGSRLARGTYPVLDRSPGTQAGMRLLRDRIGAFRLRYLDAQQRWVGTWPELNGNAADGTNAVLPRAVEARIETPDYGEITCIVELVSDFGSAAAGAPGARSGGSAP